MKAIGFLLLLSGLFWGGCSSQSAYDRLVEEELATGVRNDSLFLGLYLGMSQEDFYKACWDLNRQGLARQGSGNESVLHTLRELPYPATLNFFPDFQDGKVISMPCRFEYDAWAPWNQALQGDSLAMELQHMFMRWYGGNEFQPVTDPQKGTAYFKIDGNRQISMLAQPELVRVLIKDMRIEANRNPVRTKIPKPQPTVEPESP